MEKKGQIWLETVIYILIGLALVGLVMAFVTPKINERRDRLAVEQAIVALNNLDSSIKEVVEAGTFNKRTVEFKMERGKLTIDPFNNEIIFVLDGLAKPYSQIDTPIPLGRVTLKTIKARKGSSVILTLEYKQGIDLLFNLKDNPSDLKEFSPSAIPYKFGIENNGLEEISAGMNAYQIDISQIS